MLSELTLQEAVEELENGMEITLECDGYTYEVSASDDWIGGEGTEGYISLVLGNVIYDSAEGILKESIKHLEQGGKSVTIGF